MYKWFGRVGIVTGSWVEKYENHRREEGVRTVIKILKIFLFRYYVYRCVIARGHVDLQGAGGAWDDCLCIGSSEGNHKVGSELEAWKVFFETKEIFRGLCACCVTGVSENTIFHLQPDFSCWSFKFPWHNSLTHLHPLTSTEISKNFLSRSPWKQQCSV